MRSSTVHLLTKTNIWNILTSVFFLSLSQHPPILCVSEEIRLLICRDICHIHRVVVVYKRAAFFCCITEVVGAFPSWKHTHDAFAYSKSYKWGTSWHIKSTVWDCSYPHLQKIQPVMMTRSQRCWNEESCDEGPTESGSLLDATVLRRKGTSCLQANTFHTFHPFMFVHGGFKCEKMSVFLTFHGRNKLKAILCYVCGQHWKEAT